MKLLHNGCTVIGDTAYEPFIPEFVAGNNFAGQGVFLVDGRTETVKERYSK